MADDGRLPSSTDLDSTAARLDVSSNKRKFEDADAERETSGTGFSDGGGGNLSQKHGVYSSVAPPLSAFELAKQRAAEIAARLVGSAPVGAISGGDDGVKRARTEDNGSEDREVSNGSSHERGYGEAQRVSKFSDQPTENKSSYSTVADFQQTPYYNHQVGYSESRRLDIPNAKVGIVIGKGGETIKNLQYQSGAKIQVTRDADADLNASTRQVEIMGTLEQISRAEQLIKDVIAESAVGAAATLSTRSFGGAPGGEQTSIRVPNSKVGLIIGRGGETIRSLQSRSGARIQFATPEGQNDRDSQQANFEKIVTLIGSKQQTDMASELIRELIDEVMVELLNIETVWHSMVLFSPVKLLSCYSQVLSSLSNGMDTMDPLIHNVILVYILMISLLLISAYPLCIRSKSATNSIQPISYQSRVRGPPMHSGYNQPYFRPPGPPRWGPPAPSQRYPSYGYQQQGPYSGSPYQYPPPPPPPPHQYGGYSQQPPTGYNSGWNQTTPAPSQQPPQQGSYDSYSQQNQMQQVPQGGASAVDGNSAPNQQGYYGGYQQQTASYQQQGFQQDPSQPQQGFSQPQQGYNQPQEGYSQSQDGYTQPQQGYSQQQGSHNPQQEYSQQAYAGGYEYNQAPQDQQSYSQQGYPHQSYGDQAQYTQSSAGSLKQPAVGGYNQNPSTAPQGTMSSVQS